MDLVEYLGYSLGVLLIFTVPGWLWLRRAGLDPLFSLYLGPAAVALYAAAVVAIGVVLPWSVRTTCMGGAGIGLVVTILCLATAPAPLGPPRADFAGIVVFAVAFISMAAFSGVPSVPYGNWSSDTVGPARADSPRWPGLPADNTLPFRTGQVALFKQGGQNIRNNYSSGWWISDRTPLTGLDFAFAAGAMSLHVTSTNIQDIADPQVPMKIVDPVGFWSYQVVAILLNLMIILGVFLLARVWFDRRLAVMAALVAALMPGLFLNGIYTWPKQAIGYFMLAAVACALRRKPALAGACAALGFLVHPAGIFWVPAVLILALCDDRMRARWKRTVVSFVVPALVLVAPWEYFTSEDMHAVSRWTTSPLGSYMLYPTNLDKSVSIAWKAFLHAGWLEAVWVRIQSTAGSLFPIDLSDTPVYQTGNHGNAPDIIRAWDAAHGFAVWGMAGVVLTALILATLVRWPQEFRKVILALIVPALILTELDNGESYPFANQSMFPLVGLCAIVAAYGLLRARKRWRWFFYIAMLFELWTVVWPGLYRPYNISVASAVILTTIAIVGQLGLAAGLGVSLDLMNFPGLRRVPIVRRRLQPAPA